MQEMIKMRNKSNAAGLAAWQKKEDRMRKRQASIREELRRRAVAKRASFQSPQEFAAKMIAPLPGATILRDGKLNAKE